MSYAWILGVAGSATMAYLAWYRLARALIHWSGAAWWHWPLALPPLLVLSLAPFYAFVGARSVAAASETGARHSRRWATCGYLGTVSTLLLLLWAFTNRPDWWRGGYWWIWGAAALVAAAAGAAGWMFLAIQQVGDPIPRASYSDEWRFNHGDKTGPPALGLSMSGGGIRSAAFNIGVLQTLHANGLLRKIDVMSAVSGGSYAMSWYLLQPYYAKMAAEHQGASFDLDAVVDEMFDASGRFQAHLCRDPSIVDYIDMGIGAAFSATVFEPLRALSASMGNLAQYNAGGAVRDAYRDGIQRLFHGDPSRDHPGDIQNAISDAEWQQMNLESGRFCCVTPVRFPQLTAFALEHRFPFFIFNGAVLVDGAHQRMFWPTAFELTADDLGSDVCGYGRWADLRNLDISDERAQLTFKGMRDGLRYIRRHREEMRPSRWLFIVNLAPAISGAAVGLSYFNPAKSVLQRRLTTWTPFVGNLDLGYLFPRDLWNGKGALYVSDGGHCDNLGAYALLKRRCRTMIVVDAEHEGTGPYAFASYVKLQTQLREEMQLDLEIAAIDAYLTAALNKDPRIGSPPALATGVAKSRVDEPVTPPMSVVYIKLVLDRNQLDSYPAAVREHAKRDHRFPQDPTSNQSFTTEQFVAYRELGRHLAAELASLG